MAGRPVPFEVSMTDNVIYGIDFRAGKEEAPLCNAPDASSVLDYTGALFYVGRQTCTAVTLRHSGSPPWPDTAPSEYCAPDGDCA
jgi:hypothetical protein